MNDDLGRNSSVKNGYAGKEVTTGRNSDTPTIKPNLNPITPLRTRRIQFEIFVFVKSWMAAKDAQKRESMQDVKQRCDKVGYNSEKYTQLIP
jgi:hypothetical protein